MFGKIIYISNSGATIEVNENTQLSNLMNLHVVFEDGNRRILSEVETPVEEWGNSIGIK